MNNISEYNFSDSDYPRVIMMSDGDGDTSKYDDKSYNNCRDYTSNGDGDGEHRHKEDCFLEH